MPHPRHDDIGEASIADKRKKWSSETGPLFMKSYFDGHHANKDAWC